MQSTKNIVNRVIRQFDVFQFCLVGSGILANRTELGRPADPAHLNLFPRCRQAAAFTAAPGRREVRAGYSDHPHSVGSVIRSAVFSLPIGSHRAFQSDCVKESARSTHSHRFSSSWSFTGWMVDATDTVPATGA
jgi:hypothetical protein